MMKYKKFIIFILVLISIVVLCGCSNSKLIELEKAVNDLQTNMNDLLDEKDYLLEEIESLTKEIEELEKNKSSQQSIIYDLRSAVQEAQAKLKEVESKLDSIESGINVQLAENYYLVVGDTFQLYYNSVVQAPDPYGYYIKLEGLKGHAYNRYYEFTPTEEGTYKLTLSVCDANGVEYGSDTTNLIVTSNTISDSQNVSKNILCFGDSLTANGVWVAQGIKRYMEAGYTNVKTIGSMTKTLNGVTINYEGHGGWQWSSYLNGYDENNPSPFKATNYKYPISFSQYASKMGYDSIDELYVLLTWNGIGGDFKQFSFNDSLFSNAKKIIDIFHEEYPNAKVTLIGIPKPSTHAGLGAYYTINSTYGDNYAQSVTVMNYNQFMEDWCCSEDYASFMTYIDGMGQFDSEYNMPSESKPVNTQSATTEQVGNAMGMHPNTDGYMQLGDIFYRALMKNSK